MHARTLKRPLLCLSLLAAGCSAQPETRSVTGHIDLAAFGKSAASLVAIQPDGTVTSVAVASSGRFSIPLAVGRSAALAFKDPESGGRFAQLVFQNKGTMSSRVVITPGADLDIGEVHRAETAEQASSSRASSTECAPPANPTDTPTGGTGGVDTPNPVDTPAGGATGGNTGGTAGGTAGGTTPPTGGTNPGTLFSRRISFLVSADVDLSQECQSDDGSHSGDSLEDSDDDGRPDGLDDDVDDDGTCDNDDGDDDGHDGDDSDEDGDGEGHDGSSQGGNADLECNMSLPLGETFQLELAFLEKGAAPAEIVSVEMEGDSTWRLAELQANTPFVVTQDDCAHAGNRDQGRDRMVVTWKNADGSIESDHLDLKYCD